MTECSADVAHLYRITHLPSGMVYWGSTWGKGKSIERRFEAHVTGCPRSGGKWFKHLLEKGATRDEFGLDLMLVGPVEYVCCIESQMARDTLWPKGLNGNAGKNIVRTAEGQKVVSDAVSKAKKGRTKETCAGVAAQAKKLSEQSGDSRTEKQKAWDEKKSAIQIAAGRRPPKLPKGAKRMNNGVDSVWVPPEEIEAKKLAGWKVGHLNKRRLRITDGVNEKWVREDQLSIWLAKDWFAMSLRAFNRKLTVCCCRCRKEIKTCILEQHDKKCEKRAFRKANPTKKPKKKYQSKTVYLTCPECEGTGPESRMRRFHFENCISLKPPPESLEDKKARMSTKIKCPHCDVEGNYTIMKRWHLDNCKHKPTEDEND